MKNDVAIWTQRLARVWPYLAISVDILIINHFVFSTPLSFSFGFHRVCVISQDFPLPLSSHVRRPDSLRTPIHIYFCNHSLIYMLSAYPPLCLFFSFWAAWVFDVCWAQEQGIGYTPQTGNEKFKQIDPCLCASQRKTDRNSRGGMQIDRAGRTVEDVK